MAGGLAGFTHLSAILQDPTDAYLSVGPPKRLTINEEGDMNLEIKSG